MKKSTKNLLFLTSAVIAGMHIYNRVVDSNAERKNALKVDNGHYYKWKEGNIFYTKTGTGEPILLIHDSQGKLWTRRGGCCFHQSVSKERLIIPTTTTIWRMYRKMRSSFIIRTVSVRLSGWI